MLHPRSSVCVHATLLFLVSAIIPVSAANQGSFQGYFNFRQVAVSGDQVSVALDLRILNHTGADVANATITVQHSLQPNASYASFPVVSIAPGQAADLSQTFKLPQKEFEAWQNGATPRLVISYSDPSAKNVQRPLELIRRPLRGSN